MGNDNKQPCFAINEVVLEGEYYGRFQFALKRALHETDFQAGQCLEPMRNENGKIKAK